MRISKLLAVAVALLTLHFSNPAFATDQAFCTDGLRTVDLGSDGKLTVRNFVATLSAARETLRCRPEHQLNGLGVWKNWFESQRYKCKSKFNTIHLYVTRTGLVTSAQILNPYGFLIFNGPCNIKQ